MNKLKLFFTLCVITLMLSNTLTFAQSDISFEKYSIKDGLSSAVIKSICQDRYGFLWIATENGLNRFDGYKFKVYNHDPSDSTSIPGDNINSVIEDHEGNIWVGGYEVLAKYDRNTNKFIRFSIQKYYTDPTEILSIMEDSKNRKWITTDIFGLQLIDENNNSSNIINLNLNKDTDDNFKTHSIIESSNKEIISAVKISFGFFNNKTYYDIIRFDEKEGLFKVIKNIPKKSISDITDILEGDFGNLWITAKGNGKLLKFNLSSNKLSEINISTKSHPIKSINKILKDNDGYLWIGTTNGLVKYNPITSSKIFYTNDKANPNSISSNYITAIFQDNFGQLWVGTLDGGLNKIDLGKQPIYKYKLPQDGTRLIPIDAISALTTSPNNENIVWIGTQGNGLYRFNKKDNKSKVFRYNKKKSNSLSSNVIQSLSWDNFGNLWIGTDSSLNRINTKSFEVLRYFGNDFGMHGDGLLFNEIISDKTSKLWLARQHGVDIFVPQSNSVKRLPNTMNRSYNKNLIEDMLSVLKKSKPIKSILKVGNLQNLTKEFIINKNIKLLAVCVGEGIVGLDINTWGDHGWIEDNNGKIIWGMNDVEKSFSFGGTFKNRIEMKTIELKPGKYKLRYKSDQGYFYNSYSGTKGPPYDSLLWGIQVFEINDKQFKTFENLLQRESSRNEPAYGFVLSMELSKVYDNILWIGTQNKGIFKYNFKNGNYEHFQPAKALDNIKNDIYKIVEDDYGIVWFTTVSGLGRLDPVSKQITFITDKDGLPANNVKSILIDNYKNLWVSSIVGISEIVREKGGDISSILNFTTQDGLQGFQFSFAAHKSKSGELYFGGNNGFNGFYPGRTNRTPPKIVITDFNVVGEKNNNNIFQDDLNNVKDIVLNYKQNNFSFEFAPIHFAYPKRNKIFYKLDGVNSDWVQDNRRFASFNNLPPGEYNLELKASNGDGVWNKNIKKINITILPPWWRTTFAYILYIILFVCFVFLADRFQRRRLLAKANEKMKMQDAELRAVTAESQAKLVQAENERKSKELEEARQLQLSMLPQELPNLPNIDIAVYMQTATEVGGDYYDFRMGIDGTLNVALGDATGHGLKAGTLVTIMKGLFTSEAENNNVLTFFSKSSKAIKDIKLGRLMMAFAFLKIKDMQLSLANAGVPPIYIYRKENNEVEEIDNKGMPLGAMKNFPYKETKVELKKGDVIFLLSDGFPELFNDKKEMFGYDRVKEAFSSVADRSSEKIIEHLKNTARDWSGGKDPDDDVTFVVLKMK